MSQGKKFALLRIAFGFLWVIDATFKWMPAFRGNVIGVLTETIQGQPALEQSWIHVFTSIASINPPLFGIFIACIETALALGLIFGVFTRAALILGTLFAFMVWSVPQGFGGPYLPGNVDIDSGIVYILIFIALIIGRAWEHYTLDAVLERKFPRFFKTLHKIYGRVAKD